MLLLWVADVPISSFHESLLRLYNEIYTMLEYLAITKQCQIEFMSSENSWCHWEDEKTVNKVKNWVPCSDEAKIRPIFVLRTPMIC